MDFGEEIQQGLAGMLLDEKSGGRRQVSGGYKLIDRFLNFSEVCREGGCVKEFVV